MPGLGIGVSSATRRRRSDQAPPVLLTAVLPPASSVLVVGQSLADTLNWDNFLDPSNYATPAPGENISTVVVGFVGDTASAAETFSDGQSNSFLITVMDTGGNSRLFTVQPRIVLYAPPLAGGGLSDQSFVQASGVQSYDVSGDFTGGGLSYGISALAGVSIDSATGVVSFDTDALAAQSDTTLVITASNSGGTAQSTLRLSIAEPIVYSTQISGLTDNATYGLTAQIGTALTGVIDTLQGGESVVHQWRDDGGLVAGASAASYTPAAAQRLMSLRYAPRIDGLEVVSAPTTVRDAPPLAGGLQAVVETQGNGMPMVNVAAGFTGADLTYSENVPWAALSGTTLTIDDVVRSDTLTITATNSGGAASVDLSVTITAPAPAEFVFTNNANGTVTFTSAGPAGTASFQDNEDGTVERIA